MDFEIKVNEKLSLKLRKQEDAQAFFDLTDKNRTEFSKWFPWVEHTNSPSDSEKFIVECQEKFRAGKAADFGVMHEGKWVGSMGFHTINKLHEWAEIGYWLDADYIGKGIMTECVKAMINYGFDDLHLHRIQIACDVSNTKSMAIPKRLEFALEGTLRQNHKRHGKFTDTYVFGLLESEWVK